MSREMENDCHLGRNWLLLQALSVRFASPAKFASLPRGILGLDMRPFTALTSLTIRGAARTGDVRVQDLYQLSALTELGVRASWIKPHSMCFHRPREHASGISILTALIHSPFIVSGAPLTCAMHPAAGLLPRG